MSQSWKKQGGIKNLDSLNHLNVNSITTDDLNIRKPYKGTFSVSGEFYGFDNAEIYKKLTVRDDVCAQKNVNVYEKLIIGRSDITDVKTHFFASDSSGIGLNIESPNATLDISGEHSNILNVYSGSSHTHNVLAQNKDHQKISFEIDPSMSQIHFDRLDNSFNLMYDGHQVQFDERIVIGERKTETGIDIKEKWIPAWNDLIPSQPKHFKFIEAFRVDRVYYDIAAINGLNKNIDPDKCLSYNPGTIERESIDEMVKKYSSTEKAEGLGLALIVENFKNGVKSADIFLVLFDIESKNIIICEKLKARPGGSGLRNYWAGSFKSIIKQVYEVKYEKWKIDYEDLKKIRLKAEKKKKKN